MTNSSFLYGYSGGEIVPEFGLVIIVGVIAWIINFVFSIQVGLSRRKFGIEPPRMTETALPNPNSESEHLVSAAAGETPEEYRRYQRVHLNNVENSAFFYGLLILAGIGYPFAAFLAGLWYQIFRVVGAIGYYYSAKERRWGAFFHIGEIVLAALAFTTAIKLLMSERTNPL